MAFVYACMLPLLRLPMFAYWGVSQSLLVGSMNALIRIVVLCATAHFFYLARLYCRLREETDKRALEQRINTLEKVLPICSNCKKIRNSAGTYVQLESYISSHSDIMFNHGICPECVKLLYPDLV